MAGNGGWSERQWPVERRRSYYPATDEPDTTEDAVEEALEAAIRTLHEVARKRGDHRLVVTIEKQGGEYRARWTAQCLAEERGEVQLTHNGEDRTR